MNAGSIRKFLVALVGVLTEVVAATILPPEWEVRIIILIAVLTSLGVYAVPNSPYPTQQ